MMFEPLNPLEAMMQAASADPKKISDFYYLLLESELYLLAPETKMEPGKRREMKFEEKINMATVDFKGLKWHPAFTAPARISAYLKEPETCLSAKARHLFTMLPAGSNFWLNPLSECQKPLPGDEVALLLSGKIFEMPLAKSAKAPKTRAVLRR